MENIHPCTYLTRLQAHESDDPTYRDVLRRSEEERKQWDNAMQIEMAALNKLEYFIMVDRSRGVTF